MKDPRYYYYLHNKIVNFRTILKTVERNRKGKRIVKEEINDSKDKNEVILW